MTRTGDEYLDNSDRYTYCNNEQAAILISVHTNSHTDTSWDGTMTLYGPRESPELAQTLHDFMYPYLRDNWPGDPPDDPDYLFRDYGLDHFASGVLFKSDMPAALVEPLLMSNSYEGPLLVTTLYDGFEAANFDYEYAEFADACADFSCRRGQIARSIYEGTLLYFDAQSGGDIYVEAISMDYTQRNRNYAINTAVTIFDTTGKPVPSAEVTLKVTFPDGTAQTQTALTDAAGLVSFRTKTDCPGVYGAAVVDVIKTDWDYITELNNESTVSLTIP